MEGMVKIPKGWEVITGRKSEEKRTVSGEGKLPEGWKVVTRESKAQASSEFEPIVEVVEGIKYQGERVFEKSEIVQLISDVARKEGHPAKELAVTHEVRDTSNHLMRLAMELRPEVARAHGWGSLLYVFHVRGDYPEMDCASESSYIDRHSYTKAMPLGQIDAYEPPTSSGFVAEFVEGKWKLMPGHEADQLSMVGVPQPEDK